MMYLDENGNERITPAGAGKTRDNQHPPPARQDHPRRCGENFATCVASCFFAGSPPQVRGKLQAIVDALPQIRITPAGAGKTRCWKPNLTATQDHPRRCGENATALYSCLWLTGSPPQVRGKLAVHLQCRLSVRITPAGAGKTCGDWSMI